jgi:uncharacterized damage-inducible protein DinB
MRRPAFLLLALVVSSCAHGQQALPAPTPGVADPITRSFRGFSYYGSWLLAAFDSVPASKYEFRPTPVQQSVGYVAQHLESANYTLCSRFSGLRVPAHSGDALPDTVKARWPKDTLVAHLRASLQFCGAALNEVHDSTLANETPVGPVGSGRVTTRSRDIVLFLTDLAEHYNQMAGYMRLLGLVPPSALPRASHSG